MLGDMGEYISSESSGPGIRQLPILSQPAFLLLPALVKDDVH